MHADPVASGDRLPCGECRTGFYSADIGYDVPQGHAHIQIDLLPFKLKPPASMRRF